MELLGRSLGPYQVLEKIGHGGMAEVYKAFHPTFRRYVAIKLLGQFQKADPNFAQRFRREAQAIAALQHPNIVQIIDFGAQVVHLDEDEAHYLVMQYIEGQDLRATIEQRKSSGEGFTAEETISLLGQIADALDYAHEHGVVHRDIKPGNILIAADGRAILTDFGLAMLRDRASQMTLGHSFGTPEYIAPEQAIDSRAASPRSDIYSLGIILYEMVTGCLPFEDESPLSLALKHINQEPMAPRQHAPELPEAVEGVILQALSKDPEDRFPTARALVDALQAAWLETAAVPGDAHARPAATSAQPAPPAWLPWRLASLTSPAASRRRGVLAASVLVLGLAGLVGFFAFVAGSGPPALAVATLSSPPTSGLPLLASESPTPKPMSTPSPTATSPVAPTRTATRTRQPTGTPTPSATSSATPTTAATHTPEPARSPVPSHTPSPAPSLPPPTATPAATLALYNRILFKTDRAGMVEIYSMNPDGSDPRPVPDPIVYNELAALESLSPDRKQQIIVRTQGNGELWLVTLDGSQSEWRTTEHAAHDYDVVWSPAGDLIAFVSERTGNGDIYIATPLGFDIKRVTLNEDSYDKHPSWSPDGRYLAFWSNQRYDLRQIYIYDLWDDSLRIAGGGPFNDWDPLWVK
jgi:serine/threonine protein kinase